MPVTTTLPRVARPSGAQTRDRVFYGGMAVAMALTVFAGFAPTYYLRSWVDAPVTISGSTQLAPLTQLHGSLFSAWVLFFLVQTALVAGRRVSLHRQLGVAGVLLAAAMVVVGIMTSLESAARGGGPPGIDPLAFLIIPLGDMVLFAGFVATAVWQRRNREAHKRLMLLAYVSIIVAAVARLPGVAAFGPPGFFGLSLLFVVAGMVYDRVTRGRIHPVYLWGGAVLFLSVPLRLAIAATPAWRAVAEFLVR
jgi:hypothetical protein